MPGSTPSSGTSGSDTAEAVVDQHDLVAGERQLVAAARRGAVHRAEERLAGELLASSIPLRVSLVNLQKFTFQAWVDWPSM